MHANFKACAKKLLLSLVVCTAIISQNAGADNAMRNIFNGMMTTTSPASFETATRTGVVGGSFSYRTTNVNTNLVSMSFPKASVGCNGIDVFLGSFSMITGKCCVRHNRNGEKNGDANQAEKGVSAVTEG
ncbi:hypothetical protein A8F84_13885 [Escherichia coli]|nr:hypothetical protein A8F84_13885 [Escherichia coli]OWC91447.1 hypothetical protein A8F86_21185 [Escherichia coli]BED20018.1 hypothetical protein VEE78_42510 [Escherichia coli]